MLYTPVSSTFLSFFLKICFPPSLGSMILKIALILNHAKTSFSGPPIARITPILELFMAPGICKIGGKNVYFSFMCPLWKLCLPLCVLPHAFWMKFSHFRLAFAVILRKNAIRTRKLIAQRCKASTACKVCRIHVAMMSSFWIHWIHWLHWIHWIHVVLLESPTLNCMLYFAALNCLADQK